MAITIGADPEFFISLDGVSPASIFGLIPGTKKEPHKVNGGAIQVDGMAAEFNIEPSSDKESFIDNLFGVRKILMEFLPDYKIFPEPVGYFDQSFLDSLPKEATELGCDPDFNAYNGCNPNAVPTPEEGMRTAGGHVHIGGVGTGENTTENSYDMARMARLMDRHLGIFSLLWDKQDKRRLLYGKAGAFRVKPYGMEYRTLSNSWTFHEELCSFVFDQTQVAVNAYMNGEDVEPEIEEIINLSSRDQIEAVDPVMFKKVTEIVGGLNNVY